MGDTLLVDLLGRIDELGDVDGDGRDDLLLFHWVDDVYYVVTAVCD